MKALVIWLCVIGGFVYLLGLYMTSMPGASHAGALPLLTDEERSVADRLHGHVEALAHDIGARGPHLPSAALEAETYLHNSLRKAGYDVRATDVETKSGALRTLEGQLGGGRNADEIVLVAAHYDTDGRSPGAEANASGCAVLIEVARGMIELAGERSVRFVLFPTGAGIYAGAENSAAATYARSAHQKHEKIVAMLSLDSLGSYKDTSDSQGGPFPLSCWYPSTANFVAFVGDFDSRDVVRKCVELFRLTTKFPCEGAALPGFAPGFNSSDHAGFRRQDYPALIVTDTGSMRNEKAGTQFDTSDRIDYEKMARVTAGITRVISGLSRKASLM